MANRFIDAHECSHHCNISNEFGNLWRCQGSGMLHVCDVNCSQRIPLDRWSSICKVSRKVFPPLQGCAMETEDLARKRSAEGDINLQRKRSLASA
ncbi:predicted protein, partial [Haematococcus lacustris]